MPSKRNPYEPFRYRPRTGDAFPGQSVDSKLCVAAVSNGSRSVSFHQCPRKRKVGEWCKQHDPEARRKRVGARDQRWRDDDKRRDRNRRNVAWSLVIDDLRRHDPALAKKVEAARPI